MSRRADRRAAVELLYAADVRAEPVASLVASAEGLADYAVHLALGVAGREREIDAVLARRARGWTVDRMSTVDRNVLRVGVFELFEGVTPPAAVINEAVELAKVFSGEEAARFVNGVLGAVLDNADAVPGQTPGSVDSRASRSSSDEPA